MTPSISIAFDLEADEYVIQVTSHNRTEPAGARIFRAQPHPDVQFRHATEGGAERDARKIREYLAQLPAKKMSKAKIREGGEGS